jgi:hypothetical protein
MFWIAKKERRAKMSALRKEQYLKPDCTSTYDFYRAEGKAGLEQTQKYKSLLFKLF